jgi:hypothetical protein
MLSKLNFFLKRSNLEALLEDSYYNKLKQYELMKEFLMSQIYIRGMMKGKELFLNYEEDSLLAFTSEETLQNARQLLEDYVCCKVSTVLKLIPAGIRLLLNTGPNYGKEFLPVELSFLKEGKVPSWITQPFQFQPGQKLVIRNTKVFPQKLIDALFERMKNRENVEKAYIAEILLDGNERPNLTVGIKVSNPSNFQKDLVEMTAAVESNVGAGEYVDFIQIMENDNSAIGSFMLQKSKPFFDREYLS